jgi:hypothetical protein
LVHESAKKVGRPGRIPARAVDKTIGIAKGKAGLEDAVCAQHAPFDRVTWWWWWSRFNKLVAV